MITYMYLVGGQTYTNNLIAFGARSVSGAEETAQETVRKYAVGSQVSVHHHPRHPWHSVLEVRSAAYKWMVITGIIFLSAGILAAGVVLMVNVAAK